MADVVRRQLRYHPLWQVLRRFSRKPGRWRVGVMLALLMLGLLIFATLDLVPDLSQMQVTVLSGPTDGQDYALVEQFRQVAQAHSGIVINQATAGIAANLDRLSQADTTGDSLFALVPDGLVYPQANPLELLARLPRSRTLFLLGPQADRIRYPADLADLRIGIGPVGDATALFARALFGSDLLKELKVTLSEQPFAQQLQQLRQGQLDLGLFLTDHDAPLIQQAVADGLQIASFANAESLAARLPAIKVATLYAGHCDQLRLLPPTDRKIFQTDLLLLSNGKAARSEAVALLVLLNTVFKGLIDVNRTVPNATGLPEADELRLFVANGGPTVLDEYAPRLVDWLPPANLLHFIVVISLLANAMTLWHRFRLWRIDSARCRLEEQILDLFGHRYTIAEIALLKVVPGDFKPYERALLNGLIHETQWLRERIRRQAASLIVPMGAELYYRYQESLLYTQLQALRQFRERLHTRDEGG